MVYNNPPIYKNDITPDILASLADCDTIVCFKDSSGDTRRFIDKVRSFGARVALDDFGAGYTSFSYLKELPADLLKIDGSFIVNMNNHPANVAIVEAIVNLAGNLGMQTIAEWAEDCATVQTLVEIGVDYVQGFVVARPQHPDLLLQAVSSASFIRDEQLLRFSHVLGKTEDIREQVDLFKIRTPSINQEIQLLSGGNQQKVALGRWLAATRVPTAALLEGGYSPDLPLLVEAFLAAWDNPSEPLTPP